MGAREQLSKAVSEVRGTRTPEKMANGMVWVDAVRDDELSPALRARRGALVAAFTAHAGPDGAFLASAIALSPAPLAQLFSELVALRHTAR